VRSGNVGGLEISAKIAEHDELKNFIRGTAAIKPDVFIDIGANLGLYTCILMKNRLVPRAILFEPDRRNRVHLGANLLINGLLDADLAIHHVALGAAAGRLRLVPGPERDIGLSQIVESAPEGKGYDVEVVRFDDFVALAGRTLAIKIDVERYERKVLAGMARTLRENRGIVQMKRARRLSGSWPPPDSGWRKTSGPISSSRRIGRLRPQAAPTRRQWSRPFPPC
jgi:FkbM family methyltransferase